MKKLYLLTSLKFKLGDKGLVQAIFYFQKIKPNIKANQNHDKKWENNRFFFYKVGLSSNQKILLES